MTSQSISSQSHLTPGFKLRGLLGNRVSVFLLLLSVVGCGFYQDEYGNQKRVPAPPPEKVPYELSGSPYAIKQGDELQIVRGERATYCRLIGVRAPRSDEPHFNPSTELLNRLVEGQVVQGTVYRHDTHMRALFHARVGELDLNREMIRQGGARYDETEFPDNESFRQAEAEARRQRRGLWQHHSAQ